MRKILAILGLFVVLASVVFAMTGATVGTPIERGRWTASAATDETEGGNVTGLNVSLDSLTEKWASYYGNVTGGLALKDVSSNAVYQWTWSAGTGEVCVSTGSAFDFTSAAATTAGEVDTAWGFTPADTDSATGTLTGTCSLEVESATVSNMPSVVLLSTFETCVMEDTGTPAKDNLAFCTAINTSGVNYNAESADYELMVAANESVGTTETYNFFVELD